MHSKHLTPEQIQRGDDRLLHALFPSLCPSVPDEDAWYVRKDAAAQRTVEADLLDEEWDEAELERVCANLKRPGGCGTSAVTDVAA